MTSDVENIIELLGPREVIGQAIDALMVTDGVSRDAAFERLVQDSSADRRTVREIAAEIVQQRRGE
jgi:AmiR/NasT family two-component response regulator